MSRQPVRLCTLFLFYQLVIFKLTTPTPKKNFSFFYTHVTSGELMWHFSDIRCLELKTASSMILKLIDVSVEKTLCFQTLLSYTRDVKHNWIDVFPPIKSGLIPALKKPRYPIPTFRYAQRRSVGTRYRFTPLIFFINGFFF